MASLRVAACAILALSLAACDVSRVGVKVDFSTPAGSDLALKYPGYDCGERSSVFGPLRNTCAPKTNTGVSKTTDWLEQEAGPL